MTILTVNTGSSSVRLAAFSAQLTPMGAVRHGLNTNATPADLIVDFLDGAGVTTVNAIAHRIVHGGSRLADSCKIDADVEAEIERATAFAPLHNPRALAWLKATRDVINGTVPQVAVFDTGFYKNLPDVARSYALPHSLANDLGIRRFGFHGLAHRSMWRAWKAREMAGQSAISLQLGAGCSVTAIRDGIALDTSMGFSPLEGLMMATRAGDIDPGALLYLQRERELSSAQLEELLSNQSGLLGVSGVSGEMRALLASNEPRARFAIELYCYRARKYVGAYLAVLGRVDAILFGGGVGEHAPIVREMILKDMEWAGISVHPASNDAAVGAMTCIQSPKSKVSVWVIPVDEAALLAEEAKRIAGC
jgi:acetate kinase